MIWFNIKNLESKISTNELSDKDGLNYLLANAIVTVISLGVSGDNDHDRWIKLIGMIILVIITIWGIKAAYNANNDHDGKDFLKRFMAISWVISMRVLAVVFLLTFISGLIMGIFRVVNGVDYYSVTTSKDLIFFGLTTFLTLIAYLLVINSFKSLRIKE